LSLRDLRRRYQVRAKKRAKQKRLFRQSGKRGYVLAAARNGRAMRKLRALIDKLEEKLFSVAPGFPAWGGVAYIIRSEVRPIVQAEGYAVTSTKRWATFGNPSSDHYRGNKLNYAEDYGAGTNYPLAQKIRSALDGGIHVDYTDFYIERRGHTYRFEIIAANHGTGPHLHVGGERVS